MATDKKTIGITKANAAALAGLVTAGRFEFDVNAAWFAMAYAIKAKVTSGSTDGADTKWNQGTFDPDGSIRSLLEALYPESAEPYRLAEHLMNEGIKILGVKIGASGDLYDTLFAAPPSP